MKLINEKCRKSQSALHFIQLIVGTHVVKYLLICRTIPIRRKSFIILLNVSYTIQVLRKRVDGALLESVSDVKKCIRSGNILEAVAVPWRALPRRVSKLYFAMRVIESFEQAAERNPGENSVIDLPSVLKLRKELCKSQSLNESDIPDGLLKRLLAGTREFPPVCAIIGGILGQEVIKAISGKGDPLKNFFFFGVIEDISNPNTGALVTVLGLGNVTLGTHASITIFKVFDTRIGLEVDPFQ
ncbi:hypothetical protein HHK36_015863 [Tetracentron sinense]|uniref:Uncharacterized protein n=1 Tax=Tetracentron sinense TaxID=13715 RepID=A0A834Z5Z8_TETSI|nr:hypothetical protein HHK36_015863 [Tetracentron sinense]